MISTHQAAIEKKAYEAGLRTISALQESYTDLRSSYAAAKETRFQKRPSGINSSGSGADFHIRNEHEFFLMMEVFRDMARNDPVVSQGIRTFIANIVQGGFRNKPTTPDESVNRNLRERWHRYASDRRLVDHQRRFTFHDFEKMHLEAVTVDGDMGCYPLADGSLQNFEAHRIRTPRNFRRGKNKAKIVHGVESNSSGMVTRYHVTQDDYDGISRWGAIQNINFQQVDAWRRSAVTDSDEVNFFHLFHPRRFSQYRGVSMMAPIGVTAGMFSDIQFANMVKQQISSYFALIRTRDKSDVLPPAKSIFEEDNPCDDPDQVGDETRGMTPLQPGAEFIGDPGEKIEGFSPNVPGDGFFEQSKMLLTFIAVNFDCPLMLFMMDGSETNFSGWRGAMDQAKLKFRIVQDWYARTFHANVYRWKVRQWISQDVELMRAFDSMGLEIFSHQWDLPKWPYIEPMSDTKADILAIAGNQNSPRRIMASRGLDYDEVVSEICEDRKKLITCSMDAAMEINKHPLVVGDETQAVGWREIAHLGLDGVQMSLSEPQPQSESEPEKAKAIGS